MQVTSLLRNAVQRDAVTDLEAILLVIYYRDKKHKLSLSDICFLYLN